jgi:glycosyltransferase involved in cell wall biosynthesis
MHDGMKKKCGTGVSVVIPTYNRAKLVTRAIDSALKAIRPHDEVIVIDDGSTDSTEVSLSRYRDAIRYLKTENRGAGPARNIGIEIAKHEWIAFLDSDDEWTPDHLELHRALLSACDVLFSFSNFDVFHDQAPERGFSRMQLVSWTGDQRSWDEIIAEGTSYSRFARLPTGRMDFKVHIGSLYYSMLRSSYIPAWTALVRRDIAGEHFCFPEDLPTFEDYDCFVRLSRLGNAAYLDCSTAINHGHKGLRLTDVDDLAKVTTRIAIMERNWGSDNDYLRNNSKDYEDLIVKMKKTRIKLLVSQGYTSLARQEIHQVRDLPLVTRVSSMFPGPIARIAGKVWRELRNA